jgi:hypothetical protein
MRLRIIVINIGAQGLQRNLALHFLLRARNFRPAKPPATHNLNALGPGAHRLLHRLFHRAAERNALFKLFGNTSGNQKRIRLRLSNLHNIDANLLGGVMLKLLPQPLHLFAALANHNARLGRVNGQRNLARCRALNLNLGNACQRQFPANRLAQTQVFSQQVFIVFFGKPARLPPLNHAQSEAYRVNFMPQNGPLLRTFLRQQR